MAPEDPKIEQPASPNLFKFPEFQDTEDFCRWVLTNNTYKTGAIEMIDPHERFEDTQYMCFAKCSSVMSTVYYAYPESNPRPESWIAIKKNSEANHNARFHIEQQCTYDQRDNPYAIRMLSSPPPQPTNDSYWMEFLSPGISLAELEDSTIGEELLKDSRFIATIAIQIAAGMIPVHDKGVIIRDFKPDNVIITRPTPERGFVCLIDFGSITSAYRRKRQLTPAGAIIGTPKQCPPEQWRKPADRWSGDVLTTKVDSYSFGTIIYELATGEVPFQTEFDTDDEIRALVTSVEARLRAMGKYAKTPMLDPQGKFTGPKEALVCMGHIYLDPPMGELTAAHDERLVDVIKALLDKEPAERLSDREVVEQLLPLVQGSPYEHLAGPIMNEDFRRRLSI